MSVRGPDIVTTMEVTSSVLISSKLEDETVGIDRVRVSPRTVVVDAGEDVDLFAEAFGADGRPIPDVRFVWTVSDPNAGFIDQRGRFTAGRTPGAFRDVVIVTAVRGAPGEIDHAATVVSVTVVGDPYVPNLAEVVILPDNPTVLAGQIYRLRAVGYDERGLVIRGVSYVWQVNDPSLGRVNDIGYLTVEGLQATFRDSVTVTGRWSGTAVSATTDVTVAETRGSDEFLRVQILPQRVHLDP